MSVSAPDQAGGLQRDSSLEQQNQRSLSDLESGLASVGYQPSAKAFYDNSGGSPVVEFVGGNGSGNGGEFKRAMQSLMPDAQPTDPGDRGGDAMCGMFEGKAALCVWYTGSDAGLLLNPDTTLTSNDLAQDMRSMRDDLEQVQQ